MLKCAHPLTIAVQTPSCALKLILNLALTECSRPCPLLIAQSHPDSYLNQFCTRTLTPNPHPNLNRATTVIRYHRVHSKFKGGSQSRRWEVSLTVYRLLQGSARAHLIRLDFDRYGCVVRQFKIQ